MSGYTDSSMEHFVIDNKSNEIPWNALLVEHRVYPDEVRPSAVAAEGPLSDRVARAFCPPSNHGFNHTAEVLRVNLIKQFTEVVESAPGIHRDLFRWPFVQLLSIVTNKTTKVGHITLSIFQEDYDFTDDMIIRTEKHPVKANMHNAVPHPRR